MVFTIKDSGSVVGQVKTDGFSMSTGTYTVRSSSAGDADDTQSEKVTVALIRR